MVHVLLLVNENRVPSFSVGDRLYVDRRVVQEVNARVHVPFDVVVKLFFGLYQTVVGRERVVQQLILELVRLLRVQNRLAVT